MEMNHFHKVSSGIQGPIYVKRETFKIKQCSEADYVVANSFDFLNITDIG